MILRFVGDPSTTTTLPPPASTSVASSVASAPVAWAARSAAARNAWGVCTATTPSRSTAPPHPGPQRVAHRHPGHSGVGPRPHGVDDGREQVGAGQRSGAVVDDDDARAGGDPVEPGPDRPRPGGGSGRDGVGVRLGVAGPVGRDDQHDAVGHRPGGGQRPVEHPPAGQRGVLLGGPEPAALPGRDHDHPHGFHDGREAIAAPAGPTR